MTPTQRSLKKLREEGFTVDSVERWIPGANIRKDFLGFSDLIAIQDGFGIIAVQVTVDDRRAEHRDKILGETNALRWLTAGGRIWLETWGLHGPRGKRKLWARHREEITTEQFNQQEAAGA